MEWRSRARIACACVRVCECERCASAYCVCRVCVCVRARACVRPEGVQSEALWGTGSRAAISSSGALLCASVSRRGERGLTVRAWTLETAARGLG